MTNVPIHPDPATVPHYDAAIEPTPETALLDAWAHEARTLLGDKLAAQITANVTSALTEALATHKVDVLTTAATQTAAQLSAHTDAITRALASNQHSVDVLVAHTADALHFGQKARVYGVLGVASLALLSAFVLIVAAWTGAHWAQMNVDTAYAVIGLVAAWFAKTGLPDIPASVAHA